MRLLEKRFLRGPNIHCLAPSLVAVLDLEGHQRVGLEHLAQAAALWRHLLPGRCTPISGGAAGVARLLAQLVFATQDWAGSPPAFGDTVGP